MTERLTEELVAMRAARELQPGDYCNLGVGLPQQCASLIPEGVIVQTENGAMGYGPLITAENFDELDFDMMDAGASLYTAAPGMAFFDLAVSFIMIRSGRMKSVLGGLQVSAGGDLAIHSMAKDDKYPQIGGSMDLAWGAQRVIVAMTHSNKQGEPKIVNELTIPVSARGCVNRIITDLAVIDVTPEGLLLREFAPGCTADEVVAETGAPLSIADDIREMEF